MSLGWKLRSSTRWTPWLNASMACLLATVARQTSLLDAFRSADDVLLQAVRGISDLVTVHGLINLDFADVRTIMSEMGMAIMGCGVARGENRAIEAAQRAVSSPLLEDMSIRGARGVLINITGSADLALHEINDASSLIQEEAHEDANIIFGAVIDEAMGDEVRVTVIGTGFDHKGGRGRVARDETRRRAERTTGGRAPRVEKASDLEIGDDDLDIPAFLK